MITNTSWTIDSVRNVRLMEPVAWLLRSQKAQRSILLWDQVNSGGNTTIS